MKKVLCALVVLVGIAGQVFSQTTDPVLGPQELKAAVAITQAKFDAAVTYYNWLIPVVDAQAKQLSDIEASGKVDDAEITTYKMALLAMKAGQRKAADVIAITPASLAAMNAKLDDLAAIAAVSGAAAVVSSCAAYQEIGRRHYEGVVGISNALDDLWYISFILDSMMSNPLTLKQ